MPIIDNSPASYLATMDAFVGHWQIVNDVGSEVVLAGGYALDNLQTDRAALANAIATVETPLNTREQASADRDIKRAAIAPRVAAFNRAMRDRLAGTLYANGLPKAPIVTLSQGRFVKPLNDMKDVWTRINAIPATGAGSVPGFAPPLILPGATPYTLALFAADLAAVESAFAAVPIAERSVKYARAQRNALLAPIRTRLQQYRRAILGRFAPDSPIVASLPAYSPAPGSTPDSVEASGEWNAASGKAVITYTASETLAVASYQLRYSPGNTYKTSDEEAVLTNAATVTPREFRTTTGLAASGSVANYRVYAVTSDGNEAGSATVKITRLWRFTTP